MGDEMPETAEQMDIVGRKEAAEILRVKGPNLEKVVGLPEPRWQLASGSFWLRSDIEALAERRVELGRQERHVSRPDLVIGKDETLADAQRRRGRKK
jgi:hypothetical protein